MEECSLDLIFIKLGTGHRFSRGSVFTNRLNQIFFQAK